MEVFHTTQIGAAFFKLMRNQIDPINLYAIPSGIALYNDSFALRIPFL